MMAHRLQASKTTQMNRAGPGAQEQVDGTVPAPRALGRLEGLDRDSICREASRTRLLITDQREPLGRKGENNAG